MAAVAKLAADILPEKVVLLLFVTVTVLSGCVLPTPPLTVTAPNVLMVKLAELALTPLIELKLIGVLAPPPTVKVSPLLIVVAPKVICPVEAPPTVALSVTAIVLLILITPVPPAETVPARLICDGAVAVTPPLNKIKSLESLPSVNAPVLIKVVGLVIMVRALSCKS